jgi:hypothetical protein
MKTILTILFSLMLMTSFSQRHNSIYSDESRKKAGLCLTFGGVAFTGAAILEGGSQYGTYVNTTPMNMGNSTTSSYVTPPFWKQTPRNIMFVAGVGITITGLITAFGHR